MLSTIYFDNQLCASAVKIHDKSANDPLFVNLHLVFAEKKIPEFALVGVSFPCEVAWHFLRQHRTMGAAGFGGSFAPIVQYEKWEIHPVFPHFPYFRWDQNISPKLLAPLCGDALRKLEYIFHSIRRNSAGTITKGRIIRSFFQ